VSQARSSSQLNDDPTPLRCWRRWSLPDGNAPKLPRLGIDATSLCGRSFSQGAFTLPVTGLQIIDHRQIDATTIAKPLAEVLQAQSPLRDLAAA
jgi:hypothetical protein